MKNQNQNLPYKRAVLRDRKGDLSKEWFVEFYAWSDLEKRLIRKRIKIPKTFQDKKSRIDHANKLIAQANKLLEKGYHFTPAKPKPETDIVTDSKNDLIQSLKVTLSTISPTLRPKTVATYHYAVEKLQNFLTSPIDVFSYSKQDSIRFRDHMLITLKNSARTANNTIRHLESLFSHMKVRSSVKESPFKIGRLKQPVTDKNISFTDEDRKTVESYLATNEPELFLFTRFLYFAFIRPGELMNLRIEDVNKNERYITVKGAISKNGKTETTPIIAPLLNCLTKSGILEGKPGHLLFGSGMVPGEKTSGNVVAYIRHAKALKELGLDKKGYTLYSWKHTGAVNAYLAGVGLKELQGLLRHSSLQMTDVYLKSLGLRTDPKLNSYDW